MKFKVRQGKAYLDMHKNSTTVRRIFHAGEIVELSSIEEGGQSWKLEEVTEEPEQGNKDEQETPSQKSEEAKEEKEPSGLSTEDKLTKARMILKGK